MNGRTNWRDTYSVSIWWRSKVVFCFYIIDGTHTHIHTHTDSAVIILMITKSSTEFCICLQSYLPSPPHRRSIPWTDVIGDSSLISPYFYV